MNKRIDINAIQPQAYKAMYGLEAYLAASEIPKSLRHLIKLRASQINGCAFCINMHFEEALKDGEENRRLHLLNAWRETSLYSEEERVALAMTEEITLISRNGLSAETYEMAARVFSETQIAQIIMAIVAINAWNRIAISTHLQPGA